MIAERLAALVIARVGTSAAPLPAGEVARALRRWAPVNVSERDWAAAIMSAHTRLTATGVLAADGQLVHADELARRLATPSTATWPQLADRALPALGLGVSPRDSKVLARLADRDAWSAAIAARVLGLWHDGPPPSVSAVCDAFAWRALGLPGRAKRCPPEVRALFLSRELTAQPGAPGPPDRLLRLFAARAVAAPRPELRALRDALVRQWLIGAALGSVRPDFVTAARAAARAVTNARFGDRKVFLSAVWAQLRTDPAWAALTLADAKAQLYAAHRAGALVLARADLVAAMDPVLVADSELVVDGATFHFIVDEVPS